MAAIEKDNIVRAIIATDYTKIDDGLNKLCRYVQDIYNQTDGGVAGMFWSTYKDSTVGSDGLEDISVLKDYDVLMEYVTEEEMYQPQDYIEALLEKTNEQMHERFYKSLDKDEHLVMGQTPPDWKDSSYGNDECRSICLYTDNDNETHVYLHAFETKEDAQSVDKDMKQFSVNAYVGGDSTFSEAYDDEEDAIHNAVVQAIAQWHKHGQYLINNFVADVIDTRTKLNEEKIDIMEAHEIITHISNVWLKKNPTVTDEA